MICNNINDLCSDERCYCASEREKEMRERDLIDLEIYIENEKVYGK